MIYGRTTAIILESYLSLGALAKTGISDTHTVQWQTLYNKQKPMENMYGLLLKWPLIEEKKVLYLSMIDIQRAVKIQHI